MHLLSDLMCARLTCAHLSPPGGTRALKRSILCSFIIKKQLFIFYMWSDCVFYSDISVYFVMVIIEGRPPGGALERVGAVSNVSHLKNNVI